MRKIFVVLVELDCSDVQGLDVNDTAVLLDVLRNERDDDAILGMGVAPFPLENVKLSELVASDRIVRPCCPECDEELTENGTCETEYCYQNPNCPICPGCGAKLEGPDACGFCTYFEDDEDDEDE